MAEVPYGIANTTPHVNASPATGSTSTFKPPDGAKSCWITVTTQGVYATWDGTTPSSTNGLHIPAGGMPWFCPHGLTILMRADTTGAVVNVLWVM